MVELPSNDVLRAVLPWWANRLMLEASLIGLQHRAEKVLKEIWRFQDAVPWIVDEQPAIAHSRPSNWLATSPEPDIKDIALFQPWASMVISSYSGFYTWNALTGVEDFVVNMAGEEIDPPAWTDLTASRKW